MGILIMGLGLGKVSMLFVVVETIISQLDYRAISISTWILIKILIAHQLKQH
jgi:hypothetical protein